MSNKIYFNVGTEHATGVSVFPVKDDKVYYQQALDTLNIASYLPNGGLGTRAEAGSSRAELGFQKVAQQTARRIARNLGCSAVKAECLTLLVGSFFPKYGHANLPLLLEILNENLRAEQPLTMADFGIRFLEYYLGKNQGFIAPDLDTCLRSYFSGDESIVEVNIARFCQQMVMDVKRAELLLLPEHPGALLNQASEEIISASKTGMLQPSASLLRLQAELSEVEFPALTDEAKKEVRDRVAGLCKYFGCETGVYQYILLATYQS